MSTEHKRVDISTANTIDPRIWGSPETFDAVEAASLLAIVEADEEAYLGKIACDTPKDKVDPDPYWLNDWP